MRKAVAILIFTLAACGSPEGPETTVRATPAPAPGTGFSGQLEGINGAIVAERDRRAWLAELYRMAATTTTTTTRPRPSAPAPAQRRSGGVDWDAIAQCETGGNWSMSGPRFSGGVGFANSTWTAAMRGQWRWSHLPDLGYPDNAGNATREQQIVVAERVYSVFGLSGWGCGHYG